MVEDRIRDLHSLQEMLEEAENVEHIMEIVESHQSALKILGFDIEMLNALLRNEDVEGRIEEVRAIVNLPDRFNDFFSDRGWIFYGSFSTEVSQEAIEVAENESVDAAEEVLMSYYEADRIDHHLQRLSKINLFQPRMSLAERALQDYCAKRYHACVPVILSLTDGFIQDLHVEAFGEQWTASQGVDRLQAWDSIAGHPSGLPRLFRDIFATRANTTVDEITFPYRNGILHGRDLGYSNRIVAAKCWSTLFAVGDWAEKVVSEELTGPSEEDAEDCGILETLHRNKETRETIEKWEPRSISVGKDVPPSGPLDEYPEGTPERIVVDFLNCWSDQNPNWKRMSEAVMTPGGSSIHVEDIRERFEEYQLESYRLLDINDKAHSRTAVSVELETDYLGKVETDQVEVQVCWRPDSGDVTMLEEEECSWRITTPNEFL